MSNSHYWWYGTVKKAIMTSPRFSEANSKEENDYLEAITKALLDIEKYHNANERRFAIDEVLIRQTRTIDGVSMELNYCRRIIQSWISEFVEAVGKYKGFV